MKTGNKTPLSLVFWEMTAACNLECVHCRRLEVGKELSDADLSFAGVLSIQYPTPYLP